MHTYTRWCTALLLLWLVPSSAHAWTDTEILSVSARVDARSEQTQVLLDLGLRVREGWLSRFELLDLGPELSLDEPPQLSFLSSDGSVLTPKIELLPRNGLALQFADKRSAPRRGDYHVQLTWHTRLPQAGTRQWSLPRWPERVPDVRVEVLAPLGARPSASHARPQDALSFRDLPEQRASLLSYVSAELPRTAPVHVAWTQPAAAEPGAERHASAAVWSVLARRPLAFWLGACLSLLWLVTWRLRAEPRSSQLRWRGLVGALASGLAVALFEPLPLWAAGLGVASCLWTCEPPPPAAARSGGLLHLTTPLGAVVSFLICAALCWLRPLAPSTVACSACLAAALLLSSRGGGTPPAPSTPVSLSSSSSSARRPPNPGP